MIGREYHDYQMSRLVKLAANLNIEVQPLDPEEYGVGVRVLTTDRCHVDVLQMLFNWRICESDLPHGLTCGRYWCIAGRGEDTFQRAVIEAARYAGRPDDEPIGFIKSWDGRRSPL